MQGLRLRDVKGMVFAAAIGLVGLALAMPAGAWAAPPPNDNFGQAAELTGLPTSTTGTNVDATRQGPEPDHLGFDFGASVWYEWTAPSAGHVAIDLEGSDYDSIVAVYTGSAIGALELVAENDDFGTRLASRVGFDAAEGTTYRIAVDGFDGEQGSFDLAIEEASSISGTVTDSTPAPLEDLCVEAYDGSDEFVNYGFTNAAGEYTIPALESGEYRIHFLPCDVPHDVSPEFYDDKPDLASADPVTTVGGDGTTGIDAELAPGGSISGTVTNEADEPLRDVCVDALGDEGEFLSFDVTGGQGRYRLRSLPPGEHVVQFSDCGLNDVAGEFYDDKQSFETADRVAVAAATNMSGIDAVLGPKPPPGTISGRVTGAAGQPLQDICVGAFGPGFGFSETDANGEYSFSVDPGEYIVSFLDCGDHGVASESYDDRGFDEGDPILVASEQTVSGIDAVLTTSGPGGPPPDTVIDSGPSGTIGTSSATFGFRGTPAGDTARVQCRLDAGAYSNCSSPRTFSGLGDGSHTVYFRAMGEDGTPDPTPAQRTFTVSTPPATDPGECENASDRLEDAEAAVKKAKKKLKKAKPAGGKKLKKAKAKLKQAKKAKKAAEEEHSAVCD